ncbi:MAG: GNAT family N-acetyltransferase [Gemmatimonadales bacterium]
MIDAGDVRIVDYEPRHREAFRELNLAWIEEHFVVEEPDRRQLSDPEQSIVAPGGAILVAELRGEAIAVCALIASSPGHFELAKMATRKDLRGAGIGRKLILAAVRKARSIGAHRLSLLSHHSLAPALALYRSVGFVDVPMPPGNEYARADVAMEMVLPRVSDGGGPAVGSKNP